MTILILLPCDLTVKTNGFWCHAVAHTQTIRKKFLLAVYCKKIFYGTRGYPVTLRKQALPN